MTYQLLKQSAPSYSENNSEGNYTVTITLGLKHLDGLFIGKEQSFDISVQCNKSMTGIQEEEIINTTINNFCTLNDILISE